MPKILVIEDEELMLKTLCFRLKKDGNEVFPAQDGKQGLEILETTQVDMVITDIMLPFVSGLEIVSKIKSNPDTKHLPVINRSGVGMEEIVLEAFELGADDFITKPFNLSELSVRVKKHSKSA